MAKRKVLTVANNGRTASVYKNAEFHEYEVRFTADGQDLPDADYFTNDLTDAVETANLWVNEEI